VVVLGESEQRRIFRRALADCQAALEELEGLRAEWLKYEEQDQPAYFGWLHSTFGPLIQEIREIYHQIQHKRRIIEAVERIVLEQDCSYAEAYRIFLDEKKLEEQEAEEEEFEEEDSFEEEAEPARGPRSEGTRSSSAGSASERPSRRSSENPDRISQLKLLYRKLARLLHPDVHGLEGELGKRAASLWLQVQEAYSSGDLDRLSTLAALVQSDSDPEAEEDGQPRISELLNAARKYRRAARSIVRDLQRARLDPAFGFIQAKKTQAMRKRAQRELDGERDEAQEGLEALEAFIEQWEHQPRKPKRGREPSGRGRSRGRLRG
jgi:hypothetical protein